MEDTFSIKDYCKGVKGLIFDYGGTLDTDGTHWGRVIWSAWQEAGVAASLPEFREAYVFAERELARTRHILPQHDFSDLLSVKINIELQWLAHQNKFPADQVSVKSAEIASICNAAARKSVEAAVPVLEKLHSVYPMVVVSNFYGNLNKVLETFGIRRLFKDVIESAVVGVRKPDDAIFSLGVKALSLSPEECLVIGDSYDKDILPAQKAGCRAVLLKGLEWWGKVDTTDYNPSIEKLSELENFLL